jgi:HEAT repeat protein
MTAKEREAIRSAIYELAERGAEGVAALAKEVREGKQERKVVALVALRNLGPEAAPAVESIIPLLKSEDLWFRRLPIETLAAIGPGAKAAVPALIEAGKETRDLTGTVIYPGPSYVAEAVVEAVRAIDAAALPKAAETMMPGLLGVMGGKGAGPAESALRVLVALGPHAKPALPKLKEILPKIPVRDARHVVPVFMLGGDEGIALLADCLVDPKTGTDLKVEVARGLDWMRQPSPSAIKMLRVLLRDSSAKIRAGTLEALGSVRAPELIPDMAELLGDVDVAKFRSEYKSDDEFHAARALGNQGKEAVPALTKALGSRVPLARFQAARALALIGKDAQGAASDLEKLFADQLSIIRIEAAKAVLKSGKDSDRARKLLSKYLDEGDERLVRTLEALRELGPAGRFALPDVKRILLRSARPEVLRAGFDAILAMRAEPAEVVGIWTKLIKKNARFLWLRPSDAIRAHARDIQEIVPQLLEFLKDPDINVRNNVPQILEEMGPVAAAAVPALIKTLDDDSIVAHNAMRALGAMGSAARPAVAPLLRRFENAKPREWEVDVERETILTTLERIGPAAVEAVPRLIEWLPDYPQAARTLGKIGPEAKTAVPALQKVFANEKGVARSWSAFALVKITGKTEPYVSTLAERFTRSKDDRERRSALEALAELGSDARAALPVFVRAVNEKNIRRSEFRDAAARGLVHFGPDAKEAVPDLIDMVKTAYHSGKIAAAEALGAIGPEAKEAIPSLLQMAEEDIEFRPVVDKALARIRGR